MKYDSFNLKTFVESLDLTDGLFRLARVKPTSEQNVLVAFAEPTFIEELRSKNPNVETVMPVQVEWMPDCGILRFSASLDLGDISDDGARFAFLLRAVNVLNCEATDRISRVSVHQDTDDMKNVGVAAFTLFVPPPCMTEEGVQALRPIVSANMARLCHESAATAVELYNAMIRAGVLPNDPHGGQRPN